MKPQAGTVILVGLSEIRAAEIKLGASVRNVSHSLCQSEALFGVQCVLVGFKVTLEKLKINLWSGNNSSGASREDGKLHSGF